MAVVTRYFGVTAADAGDGTTWADRAALFTGGAWSAVITGFDFSGADSLLCLIGPGTYSITAGLTNASFANPPTAANHLVAHGCDGAGVRLEPPDPDWTTDQPDFDDTDLPLLEITSNANIAGVSYSHWRLLKMVGTASTTNPVWGANQMWADWCIFESSNSNTGARGISSNDVTNCIVRMTGTAFLWAYSGNTAFNLKIVGNPAASSGSRDGFQTNSATPGFRRCTVINCPGKGMAFLSASASFSTNLLNNMIYGCGVGISLPSTLAQTQICVVRGNYIANCSAGFGIDNGAARSEFTQNRIRDTTSGAFGNTGNIWIGANDTSDPYADADAADAAELVDAANEDFRIKAGSPIHGMGYGVSDEPVAAGGGTRAYAL